MTKRAVPELELRREDSSLAKRLRSADDDETLVDGVFLDEESITQITRLFKIIDRNSDGKLDIHDFSLGGQLTSTHYQKWQEVRDKFDYDGDGQVTPEEFRRGFKKMVLKLPCQMADAPKDTTIEGYLRALEKHINDQVQELCKAAYIWYSSN